MPEDSDWSEHRKDCTTCSKCANRCPTGQEKWNKALDKRVGEIKKNLKRY